jgi:membrane protein
MNHWIEQQSKYVSNLIQTAETRVIATPGVGVLVQAARAYGEDRCSVLAAALSYYVLLSIFPLMLFILALASPFFQSEIALRAVTGFVSAYLPAGAGVVHNSLQEVTRLRGPLSIAAAAGFLWSASGVFNLMQEGLDRAFRVPRPRPMWRQYLVSLAMVLGIGLLFGLSWLTTTILRLAIFYRVLARNDWLMEVLSLLGALILSTIVFGLLYRFVPHGWHIRWRAVWIGALIAAVLWEVGKLGFVWYLTNFALLNLVYGPLGTVIGIMLWGYVSAAILLFGAEVAAAVAGARTRQKIEEE